MRFPVADETNSLAAQNRMFCFTDDYARTPGALVEGGQPRTVGRALVVSRDTELFRLRKP